MEFICGICTIDRPAHFKHLNGLVEHLENIHKKDMENFYESSETHDKARGYELACEGLIRLPKDLRMLKCRLCDDREKLLLAQDRAELACHISSHHKVT